MRLHAARAALALALVIRSGEPVCSAPMQPQVLVHDVDPAAPREAARTAAASAFASLPPARTILVGLVSWGDGPGLEPAPWTLDGVRAAASDVGANVVFEPLGPFEATALHRWLRAQPEASPSEDRRPITLEIPGARRPRRIPRPWIGRHLCLVTPCVHVGRSRLGRATSWSGPLSAAFETLALATGAPRTADDVTSEIGHRLAAQVFASTTVVLDASWWAPLVGEAGKPITEPAVSHLVALERCLLRATSAPAEQWDEQGPQLLHAWLGAHMGIEKRTRASEGIDDAVRFVGPGAQRKWPVPPAVGAERRRRLGVRNLLPGNGLADKALDALWRVSDSTRTRSSVLRLPAAVPGPLARHWHALCSSDSLTRSRSRDDADEPTPAASHVRRRVAEEA